MTSAGHLSRGQLRALLEGSAPPDSHRETLSHLLGRCPYCSRALANLVLRPRRRPGLRHERLRVLAARAAEQFRSARQAAAIHERLDSVTCQPMGRQVLACRSSRRLADPITIDWLIERCHEQLGRDVARAVEYARLAADVADRLPVDRLGRPLALDYRARSRVEMSKALRRAGDLIGAETALEEASRLLREGTGDPLEAGRLLDALAFLRTDQRRFPEAFAAARQAVAVFRSAGDHHQVGRAMMTLGHVHGDAEQPYPSIGVLLAAAGLVDARREPRLVLVLYHNIAFALAEAGLSGDAVALLREAEPVYRQLGQPLDLVKLQWTRGKLMLQAGLLEEAAATLLNVRAGLLRAGSVVAAATVSLELAPAYAKLGRISELRELAAEMLVVFDAAGISRDAMAALSCLHQACRRRYPAYGRGQGGG